MNLAFVAIVALIMFELTININVRVSYVLWKAKSINPNVTIPVISTSTNTDWMVYCRQMKPSKTCWFQAIHTLGVIDQQNWGLNKQQVMVIFPVRIGS